MEGFIEICRSPEKEKRIFTLEFPSGRTMQTKGVCVMGKEGGIVKINWIIPGKEIIKVIDGLYKDFSVVMIVVVALCATGREGGIV